MHAFLLTSVPYLRLVHDFKGKETLHVAPRQIHDHALLYVDQGTGTCTSVHTHRIGPGCLILVPPYVTHGIELTHPDNIHMLNIHFDPGIRPDSEQLTDYLLDPVHPRSPGEDYPELATGRIVVIHPRLPSAYVTAFRRVWRHFPAATTPEKLRLQSAMFDLLAIVLGERNPSEWRPPPDPRLEAARLFLADHPHPIALREIATHADMGRSAFAAAFLAQYGMPPMVWHRHHRIECAKLDLLDGNLPVKAVAHRWGFHSAAHFTRVFTTEAGIPPVRWVSQTRETR